MLNSVYSYSLNAYIFKSQKYDKVITIGYIRSFPIILILILCHRSSYKQWQFELFMKEYETWIHSRLYATVKRLLIVGFT